MLHPRFLTFAVPAVAAAALLYAAGTTSAGGGGHGGGGGGHGGGGHAGGGAVHVSGGAVHVHGGAVHVNGVNHGGFNRGFVGVGIGFGFPYGYGYGYGGYPGYGYGGYDADYYPPTYGAPDPSMYYAPAGGGGPSVYNVGDSSAGGGSRPQDLTAHILVKIPADAEVWFGQGKTQQSGAQREFVSPALSPGKDYTYDIKARWMEGGQEVVQTRRVDVTAGAWKVADFTKPAPEAVEPPKPKP
jgi:uncharacterized protein (TIGR03000 family)